jgi:hypothetical protein
LYLETGHFELSNFSKLDPGAKGQELRIQSSTEAEQASKLENGVHNLVSPRAAEQHLQADEM